MLLSKNSPNSISERNFTSAAGFNEMASLRPLRPLIHEATSGIRCIKLHKMHNQKRTLHNPKPLDANDLKQVAPVQKKVMHYAAGPQPWGSSASRHFVSPVRSKPMTFCCR